MATKQYLDYEGAQYVIQELQKKIARKANVTDLENFQIPVASASKLGGVMIGEGLAVNENGVLSSTVIGGASSWDDLTNKPTTLEDFGITNAVSQEDLNEIMQKFNGLYKLGGSVNTFEELNAISNPEIGIVYNVVNDEGMNYVWNGHNWDALGRFQVDLSDYVKVEDVESLSTVDLDVIMKSASNVEAFKTLVDLGGEFTLANDLDIDESIIVPEGKSVTIDLDGYDIISTANTVFVADGGSLELKGNGEITGPRNIGNAQNGGSIIINGGTYNSTGNLGFSAIGIGSKVTINNGIISAQEGAAMAFDGATLEINGGQLEGKDNFAVATNGSTGRGNNTITINGGTFIGNIQSNGYEAIGIYIANNDTFIMNNGDIIANNGAGLVMRGGNVTINGGKIIATGVAGTTGWVGDNKSQMSKSAVIFHETANYPGNANMTLTINDGVFIGVDHSIEVLSNSIEPQVFINGGSFSPNYPES